MRAASCEAVIAPRAWAAYSAAAPKIVELLVGPLSGSRLAATLEVAPRTDSATIIVKVDCDSREDFQEAIHAAVSAGSASRVCLAIGRRSLSYADRHTAWSGRAGLLLDDVDEFTPLHDLAHESIEAVRFSASFAMRATDALRVQCILQAMLSLARNLGLATFGPANSGRDELVDCDLHFDYVPDLLGSSGTMVATAPQQTA